MPKKYIDRGLNSLFKEINRFAPKRNKAHDRKGDTLVITEDDDLNKKIVSILMGRILKGFEDRIAYIAYDNRRFNGTEWQPYQTNVDLEIKLKPEAKTNSKPWGLIDGIPV